MFDSQSLSKFKRTILSVAFCIIALGVVVMASPGSAQDPLITESYLLQQLEIEQQARNELAERIKNLEEQAATLLQQLEAATDLRQAEAASDLQDSSNAATQQQTSRQQAGQKDVELQVLSLRAGEAVYASAGTEIILRSGDVIALAPGTGGLADLTRAVDVRHGEFIGQNHLLVIARDDERGVEALTDAVLLVRGEIRYRPNP